MFSIKAHSRRVMRSNIFQFKMCWAKKGDNNQLMKNHYFRLHPCWRYAFCDYCDLPLDDQAFRCFVCHCYVHMECRKNVETDCIDFAPPQTEHVSIEENSESSTATATATIDTDFKKRQSVDDYNFVRVLGKGSFGKVILAERKSTNDLFAVKVIKKSKMDQDCQFQYIMTEKRVLMLAAQHPFLKSLHSCFQTVDRFFFVTEYINGNNLMFHIKRDRRFNEVRAAFYAAELTLALQFLHRHGIIHRDLKLENILLDQDGHCKLIDFGMCKEDMFDGDFTSTFCGTPAYIAPEILFHKNYNASVDWWALGIVLYEMLVGCAPFKENPYDFSDFTLYCIVSYPVWLRREAVSIVKGFLIKDPAHRLGCSGDDSQIRGHPFFHEINWVDLEQCRVKPPFKPKMESPPKSSNFSAIFRKRKPLLTPLLTNMNDIRRKNQAEYIELTEFSFNESMDD